MALPFCLIFLLKKTSVDPSPDTKRIHPSMCLRKEHLVQTLNLKQCRKTRGTKEEQNALFAVAWGT